MSPKIEVFETIVKGTIPRNTPPKKTGHTGCIDPRKLGKNIPCHGTPKASNITQDGQDNQRLRRLEIITMPRTPLRLASPSGLGEHTKRSSANNSDEMIRFPNLNPSPDLSRMSPQSARYRANRIGLKEGIVTTSKLQGACQGWDNSAKLGWSK